MERGSRAPTHVAVMPSPGMGHLIPLSELAKLLVLRHGFTATFIVFSDFSDHAQTAFLDSLPSGFSYVVLPPLPLDDVPPDAHIETRLSIMVERSVPHVRDVLRSLRRTTRLAAYVIDLFCGETLPVAKELGVPHYLLFTTSFMVLSLLLHLPALVVPLWVPQVEVLAHAATGGFLTHCGWNSLLESFVHGVPMIAWPLYAEQRTNAVMMADGLGVALRPKTAADGGGLVRREEVAEVARELMEGEAGKKAREKAVELKQAAAQAVAGRDGSSCKALAEVAQYWKDNAATGDV